MRVLESGRIESKPDRCLPAVRVREGWRRSLLLTKCLAQCLAQVGLGEEGASASQHWGVGSPPAGRFCRRCLWGEGLEGPWCEPWGGWKSLQGRVC